MGGTAGSGGGRIDSRRPRERRLEVGAGFVSLPCSWLSKESGTARTELSCSAAWSPRYLTCSYGQALAAVSAARGELGRLGVAHRRPDDYFAEMLKSDGHMQKIKDKLILEQKKMTAVENRKKDKAGSMFSKQVAAEKVKAKAADKRSQLDNIKQWRKNKGDARPSLSNDADLEGMMSGKGAAGADRGRGGADRGRGGGGAGARGRSSSGPGGRGSIFKREAKDKKFGFGGKPKHFAKSNDRESAGANTGFSRRDNKAPFFPKRGGGKAGGSAGKGSSRPGKSTRSASRGRAASGRGGKR